MFCEATNISCLHSQMVQTVHVFLIYVDSYEACFEEVCHLNFELTYGQGTVIHNQVCSIGMNFDLFMQYL